MTRDPSIRASDKDREEVASTLRESLTEGRLTLDEFDERIDSAYRAKTYGELDSLVTDLPRRAGVAPATPADATANLFERWQARRASRYRRSWSRFITVNAAMWALWGVTLLSPGHHNVDDLWPLWLTIPWGAVLVARRPLCLCSRPYESRRVRRL